MLNKTLAAAAIALAASAGAASAADLYRAPAPVAPVAPVLIPAYTWTGAFVGVNTGYIWGGNDWNGGWCANNLNCRNNRTSSSGSNSGWLAGIFAGFNWQFQQLVLGVDGSWSWTDVGGSGNGRNGNNNVVHYNADLNWQADIRGRVGFAIDRVMIYGAAGVAFADVNASCRGFTVNGRKGCNNGGSNDTGWTAGIGADWAVTNNIILGLEWKYSDFGSATFRTAGNNKSVNITDNIIQVRAAYKF
jgi:outer membrane immunogenic protein